MAGIKISALPPVVAPALTDVFPIDQGLVTYQESAQQLLTLFQNNIVITDANFSGVLGLVHGGTNAALTASNGGIIYSTATAMAILSGTATAGQILRSGATAAPTWSTATYPSTAGANLNVLTSDGTNWISVSASGVGSPLTTKGDIYAYSTTNARFPVAVGDGKILQVSSGATFGLAYSTPTYPSASGTAGKVLASDGTNIVYSTATFPVVGGTLGNILISDGANYVASTSLWPNTVGASGKVVISNGTSNVYSTPTFPNASATSGKLIQSDGTNWIASTATWPTAATNGKFVTGNGTNYVESTSTIPTSAGATANKVLLSDGTNYVLSIPTFPNASATSGKIIISDGTNWIASTPTYPAAAGTSGNVLTSDGTNWLSSTPASTALLTTKGDLFSFSTVDARLPVATGDGKVLQVSSAAATGLAYSTPTYPSASGSAGVILRSDGTNNVYTTSTYPATNAISTLLYASAANVMSALATANNGLLVTSATGVPSILAGPGTTGNILQSNAAAAPSFSTATFPSTATGTGTILRADGTNWVATTSTYPNTNAINTLLYASSANVMAALATANSSVLITSAGGVPSLSTTLPSGLAATNMNLTTPTVGTFKGSLGTTVAVFNDNSASAVNYVSIGNNITGNAPAVQAQGSDSNISLDLKGTGTGGAMVKGTSTNDSANAGYVGEYISSSVLGGSPVVLTTNVAKTVTSISLTAGDWDVRGQVAFTNAGATSYSFFAGGISQTNNTFGTAGAENNSTYNYVPATVGIANILPVGPMRISLSATTTIYLIADATFTVSTGSAYGFIGARRVR